MDHDPVPGMGGHLCRRYVPLDVETVEKDGIPHTGTPYHRRLEVGSLMRLQGSQKPVTAAVAFDAAGGLDSGLAFAQQAFQLCFADRGPAVYRGDQLSLHDEVLVAVERRRSGGASQQAEDGVFGRLHLHRLRCTRLAQQVGSQAAGVLRFPFVPGFGRH